MADGSRDLDRVSRMEPFGLALESLVTDLDGGEGTLQYQTKLARAFHEIAGQTVSEHTRSVL